MNNEPLRYGRALPKIIVIGAGITGLSAAHRLAELGAEHGFPLEVTVLEGRDRPGGVISTRESGGFTVEEGPDSFLKSKPEATGLSSRVGLGPFLIGTNKEAEGAFVLRNGRLVPMPAGLFPGPARVTALLGSPLLSVRGKLRMLLEAFIPGNASEGDESVASFMRRRFGREAYEYLVEPLLSGIYAGDPETLSVRTALPVLAKMEEEYGSVTRGMKRNGASPGAPKGGREGGGRFAAFDRGMGTLVNALNSRLPDGTVKLRSRVKRIDALGGGFRVHTSGAAPIDCDAVIVALPAPEAALVAQGLDMELSLGLSRIKYVSNVVINLAYRKSEVPHLPGGSGFLVPSPERLPVLACTFSSVKFSGRSPDDTVLFRIVAGGARNPGICGEEDGRLIDIAHGTLSPILGIKSAPVFGMVSRNPESTPHYAVGHGELVARIIERAGRFPSLRLAGNAYGGAGIPDCIRSGEKAALEIFRYVSERGAKYEDRKSCG
ncbi:MAG TPA: protoporphyrinogen oxidase [Thermodesulfobacteriota bacterium]|nr:protoporphyrinogen oxidase [Thermodesulfobacteriota bacterium]